MDRNDWEHIQDVFEQGLELDKHERETLLAQACPNREDLQDQVRELWLNELPDLELFDFDSMHDMARNMVLQTNEGGFRVDNYEILERIASGGMGVVYKAQQLVPNRLVAMKVLPLGSSSGQIHQRFLMEQETLAALTHPNVASILEAGTTSEGQPYFTMDYLGPVLTHFCDDHKLTIRQRLQLFMRICTGIQFAHQKGIIHRDIKPGNILIFDPENEAIPKIIDFGIAALKESSQPDKTQLGTIMGTPGYMSPEQAEGKTGAALDTRTDIYSLGCLLYELLVGVPPLDRELASAASGARRIMVILQTDPQKPSTRFEAWGDEQEGIAELRKTNVRALRQQFSKDLDRIVLKALARDPENRYYSAAELGEDVNRYLNGLPVQATTPDLGYVLGKFIARHKVAVITVLLILLLGSGLGFVRFSHNRDLDAMAFFLESMYKPAPEYIPGKDVHSPKKEDREFAKKMLRLLEKKFQEPTLEAALRVSLGRHYVSIQAFQDAREQFQQALDIRMESLGANDLSTLSVSRELAYVETNLGDYKNAIDHYRFSYEGSKKLLGPDSFRTIRFADNLAFALSRSGKIEEAKFLLEDTIERREKLGIVNPDASLYTRSNLGSVLLQLGLSRGDRAAIRKAEKLFAQNAEELKSLPNGQFQYLASQHNRGMAILALARWATGDQAKKEFARAEEILKTAYEGRKKLMGRSHRETLRTANGLSMAIGEGELGRPEEAVTLLSNQLKDLAVPEDDLVLLEVKHNLGNFLMVTGQTEEADRVLHEILGIRENLMGEHHPETLITRWTIAENQHKQGKRAEAEEIFQQILSFTDQGPLKNMYRNFYRAYDPNGNPDR